MEVVVHVVHNENDVVKFNEEVHKEKAGGNPLFPRVGVFLRAFTSIILLIAFGMMLLTHLLGGLIPPGNVVFFVVAAVFFLATIIAEKNVSKMVSRSALKDSLMVFRSESELMHRAIFHFSENDFRCESIYEDFSVPWSTMIGVIEYPSFFLFYPNASKKYMLPRRCLSTDEDLKALYRFIEAKVLPTRMDLKYYDQADYSPEEVTIPTNLPDEDPLFDLRFTRDSGEISSTLYETLFRGSSFRMGVFAALSLMFIGTLFAVYGPDAASRGIGWFLAILGVLIAVGLLIFCVLVVRSSMESDTALPSEAHLLFLEDAFVQIYPSGKKRIDWSRIYCVRIRKNFVQIYITPSIVTTVPFSAFYTEADKNRFLTYIKEKAPRIFGLI